MKAAGCEIKAGKHLAFKLSGGGTFIRCKSLGDDYTEDAIRERISGKRVVTAKQKTITPMQTATKPNLLIDIQAKIQQGYGLGFEQFAKLHNLKEAAKTLIFLQERGLTDYDDLYEKADAASKRFGETSDRIKVIEARLGEISALQKHIGAYIKTRDVYKQYRDSGWSKKFYAAHESDIIIHRAAKKHFDSLGLKKLPTMDALKKEYATLTAEKKRLYQDYRPAREEMIALLMAKQNVDQAARRTPATGENQRARRPLMFMFSPCVYPAPVARSRRQRRLTGGALCAPSVGVRGSASTSKSAGMYIPALLLARARGSR